ncbi:IS91 family transposase [Natronospora cellulosivora (SeqCode)]
MPEIQDILIQYWDEFKKKYKVPYNANKVIRALINCRTSAMGGHIDKCEDCGHIKISYNSCRDRHCPKCQGIEREQWILKQQANMLNEKYFHVVFTIPDDLNPIALKNQKVIYSLLFKTASETLQELAADKKYLGAQIGITAVLHTWGQTLSFHPHLHCIIPAGGLSSINQWIKSKNNFFMPIRVIAKKFRGKFIDFFKKEVLNGNIKFYGNIEYLNDDKKYQDLIDTLYYKNWVVFCEKTFKDASHVLNYLARYTNRVAIANSRIIKVENHQVTFRYKDYKDNGKTKFMTLDVLEFIRRFLMHILPKKFKKIRYFGIMASRNRKNKLLLCKKLTRTKIIEYLRLTTDQLIEKLGLETKKCPICGCNKFVMKNEFPKTFKDPPDILLHFYKN